MTEALQRIREWRADPVRFVRDVFQVEPDLWQARALRAFAQKEPRLRIALRACVGPGKLQPKSLVIDTPQGAMRFGDLRPGMLVFAEDGTPTKITAVHDNGVVENYRVVFDDGSETLAGADHLWKAKDRNGRLHDRWSVVTTEQMRAKLREFRRNTPPGRMWSIPIQGPVTMPEAPLPFDPYAIGLWLGDGSARSARITKPYHELDDKLRARGLSVSRAKSDARTMSVAGLCGALRTLGLFECRSYERFVPPLLKYASIAQRRDVLCGLLDTDGEIGARDGAISFSSSSEQLAKDVAWLVRSLGGKARLKPPRRAAYRTPSGERKECRPSYRVTLALPFNPFTVKHKASRWRMPEQRYLQRYVDRIEPFGPEDSVCIEVEHPSRCYLTNDFIVTHNSAILSWLGWNFLVCYADVGHHPKGACVSITSDNLRDNLWAEFSKWQSRSPFLLKAFQWTAERIFAKDHPETWFLSARSFAKKADVDAQGRTLSGIHGRFVLFLIDESGDIPVPVLRSAEQAFSETGVHFGRIIQAGNPSSLSGALYAAAKTYANQWLNIRVTGDPDDPERSPRIDLDWARQQIADAPGGRDNDWVKYAILGEFPQQSLNALLGVEEVEAAMKRQLPEDAYSFAQKRLGVDVARFGDDATVIFPRQGRVAFRCVAMRNAKTQEIAARVAKAKKDWESEVEFVDGTGGYGAGVIDMLQLGGHSPYEVQFSGKADDPRFYNKRTEMWWRMAEWVKKGGALPPDPQLLRELTEPLYYYQDGKIRLEEKEQIKKRLGFSPDRADGLALTFAIEDMPSQTTTLIPQAERRIKSEWDPI